MKKNINHQKFFLLLIDWYVFPYLILISFIGQRLNGKIRKLTRSMSITLEHTTLIYDDTFNQFAMLNASSIVYSCKIRTSIVKCIYRAHVEQKIKRGSVAPNFLISTFMNWIYFAEMQGRSLYILYYAKLYSDNIWKRGLWMKFDFNSVFHQRYICKRNYNGERIMGLFFV